MSTPDRRAIPVEALTDNELEILRLLTAGHTVKSIAVRLGRSEGSINERLRDARRKTGVGSSRELARYVAGQKIWDKNIDLSPQGSSVEHASKSPISRRLQSKGTLIMLIAMAIAAAGIVVATTEVAPRASIRTAQSAPLDRPSLAGTWSLDVSRIPPQERPRSVTLDFSVGEDREWTGRSEMIAADDSRQYAQATATADGVPVPVTGLPSVEMVSMRQPAPNTLVMTFTRGGDPVSTRVYTVEEDGRSMKETIVWAGDVTPRMVTNYFKRVG